MTDAATRLYNIPYSPVRRCTGSSSCPKFSTDLNTKCILVKAHVNPRRYTKCTKCVNRVSEAVFLKILVCLQLYVSTHWGLQK